MINWLIETARYPDKNSEIENIIELHFEEVQDLTDHNGCSLFHIAAEHNTPLLEFLINIYARLYVD